MNEIVATSSQASLGLLDNSTPKSGCLKHPFRQIAIALSGGGFRAASFSIGAMSYLDHLKYTDADKKERSLLENIEFISSASGGTITGILYSMYVKKDRPFKDVYHDLLAFMSGQQLLKDVLELINDDEAWRNEEKSRNFINAFARIYDKRLFKGEKFGVYANAGRKLEVCFNATEFYRGISFRFQTDGSNLTSRDDNAGKVGNAYIYFDDKSESSLNTLKSIKLGDILASSSCFPAGFEPIIFPRDFTYQKQGNTPGLNSETLSQAMIITDYDMKKSQLQTSIGLMDGGVDDNQGLYSAMLADKRRRSDKKNGGIDNAFDLIIVTDVASYFMDPYIPPAIDDQGAFRKKTLTDFFISLRKAFSAINKGIKIGAFLAIILLLASLGLLMFAETPGLINLGYLLLSPAILSLVAIAFLLGFKMGSPSIKRLAGFFGTSDKGIVNTLKARVPSLQNFSSESLELLITYLRKSPVGTLEQMISARVNSMLSLVLDINLKQTRRLIFDIFYGDKRWDNRRLNNVIYELSTYNLISRAKTIREKFDRKEYKIPNDNIGNSTWANTSADLLLDKCTKMNSIAEQARTMGTTLWYDSKDAQSGRMEKVIASGQFTTCAKLLEYALVTERLWEVESQPGFPAQEKTLDFSAEDVAILKQLKDKLIADYNHFKDEPDFLYKLYPAPAVQ